MTHTKEEFMAMLEEQRQRHRSGQYERNSFSGMDFSFIDLRGENLVFSNLRGINLYGANLEGANLRNANLREANFVRANLRGADLRFADITEARFDFADLRGAKLPEGVIPKIEAAIDDTQAMEILVKAVWAIEDSYNTSRELKHKLYKMGLYDMTIEYAKKKEDEED